MKTLGKGSLALHREVPGYGGGLQAVRDEGQDSKTQGAMKGALLAEFLPSLQHCPHCLDSGMS
jgi:hypothetical protein